MAIFSRTKSRAKRAGQQDALKLEVEEKTTTPDNAPERGRKGTEAGRPSLYDHASAVPPMPGPSQPARSFYNTSNGSSPARTRNDSLEGSDYLTALNSERDHSYAHSSSDSGYSSAGPQSRPISQSPTVQREMGCFQISNKSTTQSGLGEETAREPSIYARGPSLQGDSFDRRSATPPKIAEIRFLNPSRSLQGMRSYFKPDHGVDAPSVLPNQTRYQDARYQRQIQQSMPMRPTSVPPPQRSRSKSERVSRSPSQCSSSSSGAVSQSTRSAYALRSLAAVPPSSRLPYDWSNQIPSNLDQQLREMPLQLPTSPTSPKTPSHTQPRRSDYVPPLSILEGLKVNRRGLILDEEGDPIGELYDGDIVNCVREKCDAHGAVLNEYGRVVGRVRTLLRKDEEPMLRWKASNGEQLHGFPLPPVSATGLAGKSPRSGDARYKAQDQPAQMQKIVIPQRSSSASLNTLRSSLKRWESVEQHAEPTTAPRDSSRSPDVLPQMQDLKQFLDQQEVAAPRPLAHACSDSLASVPESHSTSEAEISDDDGSSYSKESQQKPANEFLSNRKRVRARSSAMTEPPRRHPMSSHVRSVSEPTNLTTALPPVPPRGKRPLKPNQARLFPTDATLTRHASLTTPPSRVQSLSPPAFPGRGLTSGLTGNNPFAGCPTSGMPAARRLTTTALPTTSPPGMVSLNTQLPVLRPRASGTIPLVRSPLSSQGKTSPRMGA